MEMKVSLHADENGYTGRECPSCRLYFKVKFGTGLPNAQDCHCPYCNFVAVQDQFFTQQQIDYAKSVVLNQITGDLINDLKKLEIRPSRNTAMSLSLRFTGRPTEILHYSEKEVEQHVQCTACTLEYAIYGVFGYCPDCGLHNTVDILNANFAVIKQIMQLADGQSKEIARRMIENALEDVISAFDAFGRNSFQIIGYNISFQRLIEARDLIKNKFSFDIFSKISNVDCDFIIEQFQLRHTLAHNEGVIDGEFMKKTTLTKQIEGQKAVILEHDINKLIALLTTVAQEIQTLLSSKHKI